MQDGKITRVASGLQQNFPSWNHKFGSVLAELTQVHLRTMKPAGLPPMENIPRIRNVPPNLAAGMERGGTNHHGYTGHYSGLPDVF